MMNSIQEKYQSRLSGILAPGTGCHSSLLSVANTGVIAGINQDRLFSDIRNAVPAGKRTVPDREIDEAIQKAAADHQGNYRPTKKPYRAPYDGQAARQRIITQATISDEVDIWERSPIRLHGEPEDDAALFLFFMFRPDDLVFIGEREEPGIIGKTIRTAGEWIAHFNRGGQSGPLICSNPLTGKEAKRKNGKATFRGDANVKRFRFCIIEFDDLSYKDQLRFWSGVKLPIRALVDSGGKSIHAWIDLKKLAEVTTYDQWVKEIKQRLYEGILIPMGADGTCSNPSRLSRLPGHMRSETKRLQRLLWLSSKGRRINVE